MWRILSLSLCFTHILHSLSVHVGCILLFHTFCLSIPLKHIKLYNYLSLSLTQTFKKRKKSFINFHFFVFFQNNLSLTPLSLSLSLSNSLTTHSISNCHKILRSSLSHIHSLNLSLLHPHGSQTHWDLLRPVSIFSPLFHLNLWQKRN